MRIGLLGPLKVTTEDGTAEITAPNQRRMLAELAVHAGNVVHVEQLAVIIWGEPLPARWRQDLPPLAYRLRDKLGADRRKLVRKDPGYLLDIDPQNVDLWVFDALHKEGMAAAQACDWREASRILTEAMNLWRGIPFADAESEGLLDIQRDFEYQRRAILETCAEADVRLSRHTARSAIRGLRKMAADDPRQHPSPLAAHSRTVPGRKTARSPGRVSGGQAAQHQ